VVSVCDVRKCEVVWVLLPIWRHVVCSVCSEAVRVGGGIDGQNRDILGSVEGAEGRACCGRVGGTGEPRCARRGVASGS